MWKCITSQSSSGLLQKDETQTARLNLDAQKGQGIQGMKISDTRKLSQKTIWPRIRENGLKYTRKWKR